MTERKNNVDIPIEWTPGIPDGLTLKCPYCKQIPEIDYLVPDPNPNKAASLPNRF